MNDQLQKIQQKFGTTLDARLLGSDWYLTPRERKNYPPAWVAWLSEMCPKCGLIGGVHGSFCSNNPDNMIKATKRGKRSKNA